MTFFLPGKQKASSRYLTSPVGPRNGNSRQRVDRFPNCPCGSGLSAELAPELGLRSGVPGKEQAVPSLVVTEGVDPRTQGKPVGMLGPLKSPRQLRGFSSYSELLVDPRGAQPTNPARQRRKHKPRSSTRCRSSRQRGCLWPWQWKPSAAKALE